MVATPLPRVKLVSLKQSENARSRIVVTLSGMFAEAIRFCFDVCNQGTPVSRVDAAVDVDSPKVREPVRDVVDIATKR